MCKQLSAEFVQKFLPNLYVFCKELEEIYRVELKNYYIHIEEMFCWNLHQIYVKIFGVEMKFNDKNCMKKKKRNGKEIEHKMKK